MVVLQTSSRNMRSIDEHLKVIEEYLANEVSNGRVAGPFQASPFSHLQCCPFGVIPRKGKPGKCQLIIDLSSPHGHSVNDGITKDPYSLQYISVDDAIRILMVLGPGALIAMLDVVNAYRNVALRPNKRYLFGMRWPDYFFVDLALLFDFRSTPFIFNSVAEAIKWILKVNYSVRYLLHYLDKFLSLAPAASSECAASVAIAQSVLPA